MCARRVVKAKGWPLRVHTTSLETKARIIADRYTHNDSLQTDKAAPTLGIHQTRLSNLESTSLG